jgi:hypothetical protein
MTTISGVTRHSGIARDQCPLGMAGPLREPNGRLTAGVVIAGPYAVSSEADRARYKHVDHLNGGESATKKAKERSRAVGLPPGLFRAPDCLKRPRGLHFRHQFLFLTAEPLAELLELLAVGFAAGTAKSGVIEQLAQQGQPRRSLLARLLAGTRHLLQLLLDDLVLVGALEGKAARLLIFRFFRFFNSLLPLT